MCVCVCVCVYACVCVCVRALCVHVCVCRVASSRAHAMYLSHSHSLHTHRIRHRKCTAVKNYSVHVFVCMNVCMHCFWSKLTDILYHCGERERSPTYTLHLQFSYLLLLSYVRPNLCNVMRMRTPKSTGYYC